MPIDEPGLKQMVDQSVEADQLDFSTSYTKVLNDAEFAFVAAGTPSGNKYSEADIQSFYLAVKLIPENLDHAIIIVNKSTVPVGTGD